MNWFQRYGIPGAYFVALSVAWLFALSPQAWEILDKKLDAGALIAFAALIFLSIGYVISIFSQWLYLMLPCLGVHRAAAREANVFQERPNNERFLEAEILLVSALRMGISVSTHQYIRNWIARRMDVVAINQSVILATVFATITALVLLGVPSSIPQAIPLFISIFVVAVMVCSIWVLRRQVIMVIVGVYR